jgi:hypothetical protein
MSEKLTSKEKLILAGLIGFFVVVLGISFYMAINHPFLSFLLFFR